MHKQWKQLLALLVCSAFLAGLGSAKVLASSDTTPTVIAEGVSNNLRWVLTSDGVLTFSGESTMFNYEYASAVPWYEYRDQILTVILEDGVNSIGDYAFCGCTNLTCVTIPDGIGSVGEHAFGDCSSLIEVNIPSSVRKIGACAFTRCESLEGIWVDEDCYHYSNDEYGVLFNKDKTELIQAPGNITGKYVIPETVNTIGNYAFDFCKKLTDLSMGNNVISIGQYAFAYCLGLTELYIGDGVESIDHSALWGCSNLVSVNCGNGLTKISEALFSNAAGLTCLKEVTIGSAVTSIDDQTFSFLPALEDIRVSEENETYCSVDGILYSKDMTSLLACPRTRNGSFEVPEGTTTIDRCAFYSCTSLTDICLPEGITGINANAFYGCTGLTSITLPDSIIGVGNRAFESCNALKTVDLGGIKNIGDYTFQYCTSLEKLDAGERLTQIGMYAFRGCSALTDITLPLELTCINNYAFMDCVTMQTITFLGGYPSSGIKDNAFSNVTANCYYPDNDVTWTEASRSNYGGTLTWIAYEKETPSDAMCGQDITWELSSDGILIISGTGAMFDYSVEDLAYAPWYERRMSITSIQVEDGVAHIGNAAFYGCSAATNVSLPSTVTSIGNQAFHSIAATSLELPENLTTIGNRAFYKSKLVNIILPEGVTEIGSEAFASSKLNTAILPNSLTYIPDGMFSGCYYLVTVDLPEYITTIGDKAFASCAGLSSLVLPEGLISIGDSAFSTCGCSTMWGGVYPCYNFSSITLPSTLQSIGANAFYWCQSLHTIEIPDSVRSIGASAFARSGIRSITIPPHIAALDSTFHMCKSLASVTFKWGAPEIGDSTFKEVTATCYYPGNNESWTSDMLQNYGGTLTWIAQDMEEPSDGSGEGGSGGGGDGEGTGEGSGDDSGSGEGSGEGGSGEGTGGGSGGSGGGEGGSGGSGNGEGSGGGSGSGEGSGSGIEVSISIPGAEASGIVVTAPEGGWAEGSNTFTVACERPCVVAVSYDGGVSYIRLSATETENGYSFTAENLTSGTILAVVMAGDTNSDGSITNADVMRLRAAYLGKVTLDALQNLAADVNGDGTITNADIMKLLAVFLGKASMSW